MNLNLPLTAILTSFLILRTYYCVIMPGASDPLHRLRNTNRPINYEKNTYQLLSGCNAPASLCYRVRF